MCVSKKILAVAIALAAVPQAHTAMAAVAYTAGGAASTTAFNAAPGATLSVPIYIREFGGSSEITSDAGLFSAGFRVQRTSAEAATSATVTGVAMNTALFNHLNAAAYAADHASLYIDQDGGGIDPALPTAGLLLVGTVSIQASLLEGTTTYSIGDFDADPDSAQVVTYEFNVLDAALGASPATFTVTVVPEPASAMLLACAACVFARRGRRA